MLSGERHDDEIAQAAWLYYVGNLSQQEVSDRLGISRFKVLRTSLAKPDVAGAATVVPAGDSVVTGIAAAGDALYVRKRNGGVSELFRLPWSAATPVPVQRKDRKKRCI